MKNNHNTHFYSIEEIKRTIEVTKEFEDGEQIYYFIGALRYLYDEFNKQKEILDKIKEKGVMYYDPEYSKIYGELCSMPGANNTRTPVIVIDDEILDYLEEIE